MSWLLAAVLAAQVDAGVVEVAGTYPGDERMWSTLVAKGEHFELGGPVTAAVAPHHLIDGFELAGFWNALAKQHPSTIVVVAPDHFVRGVGVTGAGAVRWPTVFGALDADAALAEQLGLETKDLAFQGEHSVHVHAPFIRALLPATRFVPVLLQWETPREQLEALAQRLHATLPPDALVVASVDFSHYQPEPWASFHDEASLATVTAFDLDGLFEREVDSPEALFVALRFGQLRGASRATRVLHTNSQRRREHLMMDSTSHQYFVLTKGAPRPVPAITVTVTGDAPPPLGVVGPWRWSMARDAGMPSSASLALLRGREDRFFMGADATVFSVAPGARQTLDVRGASLSVLGVDLSKPLPSTLDGACVVAVAHRAGVDEGVALERARHLLALGAHAVVGRDFGALRPIERLDGGVFAPSLGPLTRDGRARVLGVTCTGAATRARSVPIVVERQTPRLDAAALERERGLAPD